MGGHVADCPKAEANALGPDLGSARLSSQATLLMQGQTLCKLLHQLVEAVGDHVEVPVWHVRGHSAYSRDTALLHPQDVVQVNQCECWHLAPLQ